MRRIQFVHNRNHFKDGSLHPKGGRTVVMEKITLEEFEAVKPSLNEPAFVLKVGVAACSLKDNYCKSIGRTLAYSRMKDYHLFATAKSEDELQLFNSELGITLFLKKVEGTNYINFIDLLVV